MTAGSMICLVIYALEALIMIGIGIAQLKSRKPVGFYSGEEGPRQEELTDVVAWNKKHGTMWVIYGIIIILSYFAGMLIRDSIWCVIPMCGGVMVPVVFMIRYHNKLKKEYMR